jgi:hypothetical protein
LELEELLVVVLQMFNQLQEEVELEIILILLEDLYLLQQPLAAAREES